MATATTTNTARNHLTCSSTRPPTFCASSTKLWISPLISSSKSSICAGTGGGAAAAGAGAGFGGSTGAGAAAGEELIGFGALGSSIAMAMSSKREVAASNLLRMHVSRARSRWHHSRHGRGHDSSLHPNNRYKVTTNIPLDEGGQVVHMPAARHLAGSSC